MCENLLGEAASGLQDKYGFDNWCNYYRKGVNFNRFVWKYQKKANSLQ
jgi:hypothetical protein